jgi:anaerobic ribonucleoside-triphosphate reductase activating protein
LPQTWATAGGKLVDSAALARQILTGPEIEGVTFHGVEPFAQAEALGDLGSRLHQHGPSVVTFTGYALEELQSAVRSDYAALLAVTDLLIARPFQREQQDFSRPWVGSANQRFHFLTARYAYLADQIGQIPNRVESARTRMSEYGSMASSRLKTCGRCCT